MLITGFRWAKRHQVYRKLQCLTGGSLKLLGEGPAVAAEASAAMKIYKLGWTAYAGNTRDVEYYSLSIDGVAFMDDAGVLGRQAVGDRLSKLNQGHLPLFPTVLDVLAEAWSSESEELSSPPFSITYSI